MPRAFIAEPNVFVYTQAERDGIHHELNMTMNQRSVARFLRRPQSSINPVRVQLRQMLQRYLGSQDNSYGRLSNSTPLDYYQGQPCPNTESIFLATWEHHI